MHRLRVLLLTLTATTLATLTPLLAATRLPVHVVPGHYALTIAPDLASETFTGSETIDVELKEPVDTVTLHAVELNLHDVTIGGKPAVVTVDATNEVVTLKVAEPLPAGRAQIAIAFDGKLSQGLRGLYLSRTAKRKYAVTQFEAMSARRAFPCFDEPAMKATFDVTLVVDAHDTAISNGSIVSDTPAPNGRHALAFSTTKRLPTYLLAFLVGDFQCISGASEGVPIRVCSTPGLQHLGRFSLEAAQASIRYFNRYYGIPYPFGKLDMIGIPDFAAGAMENAGAITYRETDLLLDEKTASVLVQKRVAEVVAHEIAHQWFGDLVTMKWWNDIWLNEGFATFMSEKPIAEWKPEWRSDLDKPVATADALLLDSQLSTRAIRLPASTTGEGGALFDSGITYGKTAAVLRMVEEWVGPDTFRDAIRVYLKKYSYSNAQAEDLWSTMREASKRPVDPVLESFVENVGAPLLEVTETCDASQRRLTVRQSRLLRLGAKAEPENWTIPVCIKDDCRVLASPSESIEMRGGGCDAAMWLDRGGAGYYIVDYPPAVRASLRSHLGQLTPAERIAFHGNEWILVRNGRRGIDEYLALVRALPLPADRQLVTQVADNLLFLDQRLAGDANRAAWQKLVRDTMYRLAPATWEAPAKESSEQRIARASALWTLGVVAHDEQVIAGAQRVAGQYIKDSASVDALIADKALRVAAAYGDEAFFERVTGQLAKAPSPELAARYRSLLPLFRNPKVTARALDYIYSDRIRTQDAAQVISAMLLDPATRPAAWTMLQSHWSELETRSPSILGRSIASLSGICDPATKKELETFLTDHPLKNGARSLARTYESIDACIALRAAQQETFDAVARAGGGARYH
ncbi:MAG: Peptidase rane alanine aminopeptidase [Acidobacteria bacterium]|nr:Peptidase rane alanine aminopeptidase [Acidobacteriota bacterium]